MKRTLAILLLLSVSAGFSIGGETALSPQEQRRYEDLSRQLENINPDRETYEEEKLKIYKELLELMPEDPIYSYYVENLSERVAVEELQTHAETRGNDENEVFTIEAFIVTSGLKSEKAIQERSQEFCENRWTRFGNLKKKMYKRCLKIQLDGYKKLKSLHDRNGQKKIYVDILLPYCSKKWTKKGLVDARMMAYCLKKEMEGFQQVIQYQKLYDKAEVTRITEQTLMRYGSWSRAVYEVRRQFRQ